jgi:flagellar biosynthesis protein
MIDIRDDREKDEKPEAPPRRPVAVALRYDEAGGKAPVVVASGRDRLAEQILEIAFANGVKVREDADLAEILSAIEVDSEIPVEAFAAVAEILVYLYRVNRQELPEAAP